jgi:hypothetical protein
VLLAGLVTVPACSLDRSPLLRAVDGGMRDTGVPFDAGLDGAPLDAPVPSDVPIGPDTPDLDAPMTVDTGVDAFVPVDAPIDGGVDAPIDAFVPPPDAGCVAGTSRCAGGSLQTCVGGAFTATTCQFGCEAAPVPHCRVMVPTNVSEALSTMLAPGPALAITARTNVDTTMCNIPTLSRSGTRVAQNGGGPTVCLFYVSAFSVSAYDAGTMTGGYLSATGDVPLVIVATGDTTISGVIDVSSYAGRPAAAGAGTGGMGGTDGVHSTMGSMFGDGGGGGGAFCGSGGDGGDGSENAAPGVGGTGATSTLIPLRGGATGGRGSGGMRGFGGLGGGAFQLSVFGNLTVNGYIVAGGAGGLGGDADASAATSGGGGGSGGGIFLEAYAITLGGGALVNVGGGGGASGSCGSSMGVDGQNAAAVAGRAAGGIATCSATPGGAGGGDTTLDGADGMAGGNNGPGGGGGVGCMHLRTMGGTTPAGLVNPRSTTTGAITASTIVTL